jgi:Na+-translocating ferredoxin:NAD+ oxidoreductase RnfA subunit
VHYLLDLLQGLGIAAAIGIRPFLPTLLAGALAAANLGLDFDHTKFAFLEGAPFLIVIAVLAVLLGFVERRRGGDLTGDRPGLALLICVALVLGALQAAGSLDDRSSTWWPGLIAGVLAAGLGFAATRSLFGRVRGRLDAEAASMLPFYGEAVALAAAGLSILLPPLAILVVAGLAWLLAGGRRRAGEKYAGLRILR